MRRPLPSGCWAAHRRCVTLNPNNPRRRSVKQYPQARVLDSVLCIRIDAPVFFGNLGPLTERLAKYEACAGVPGIEHLNTPAEIAAINSTPKSLFGTVRKI